MAHGFSTSSGRKFVTDIFDEYPDLQKLLSDPEFEYPFATCFSVVNKEQMIGEEDVAAALIVTYGNFSATGRLLHKSRARIASFVRSNTRLSSLLTEVNNIFLDDVEAKYRKIALDGDSSALRYLLGTLAKDRGYSNKQEHDLRVEVKIEGADAAL